MAWYSGHTQWALMLWIQLWGTLRSKACCTQRNTGVELQDCVQHAAAGMRTRLEEVQSV
jgi:hypothetical protein